MTVAAGRDTRRAPARDAERLLALGRAELDALFARSEAGPVPDGEYRGTLIAPLSPVRLRGAGALAGGHAWRGKVFDAGAGRVVNRVLPFGLRAVTAEVLRGQAGWTGANASSSTTHGPRWSRAASATSCGWSGPASTSAGRIGAASGLPTSRSRLDQRGPRFAPPTRPRAWITKCRGGGVAGCRPLDSREERRRCLPAPALPACIRPRPPPRTALAPALGVPLSVLQLRPGQSRVMSWVRISSRHSRFSPRMLLALADRSPASAAWFLAEGARVVAQGTASRSPPRLAGPSGLPRRLPPNEGGAEIW
jgi:hypothetical protein